MAAEAEAPAAVTYLALPLEAELLTPAAVAADMTISMAACLLAVALAAIAQTGLENLLAVALRRKQLVLGT